MLQGGCQAPLVAATTVTLQQLPPPSFWCQVFLWSAASSSSMQSLTQEMVRRRRRRKRLVCLDEMHELAALCLIFKQQIDWVEKLIAYFSFHKNPTLCFDKSTESTADFSTTCGLIWFGFVLCAACCSGCSDKPLFGLTATTTVVELEDQCKCWCWCWCGRSLCSELAGCCLLRSQCNWAVSVLLQTWLNLLVDDLQCGNNITKLGKKKHW